MVEVVDGGENKRWKTHESTFKTGVDWIGSIPKSWKAIRIKHLCTVRRGASPRPIDDPRYLDDDGENAWVRISDVTASERYLTKTTQRLSFTGQQKSVTLQPGRLFLSIAATVGKPIITKVKCCIHDGFVYFDGLRQDQDYWYYAFVSGEPFLGLGKHGTQLNLNTDTIGEIVMPVPPLPEQRSIAAFLDRQTARIDTLIAHKRRLIELLEEKVSAAIRVTVTGTVHAGPKKYIPGLFNAIPEGWDVSRLGYCCEFVSGKAHEPYIDADGDFICVNSRFVSTGGEAIKRCTVNESPAEVGDTLTVMSDLPNGRALAKAFFVERDEIYAVNQRVCIVRPKVHHPKYLYFLLDHTPLLRKHDDGCNQTHLSNAMFTKMPIHVPPPEQQVNIAQELEALVSKTTELKDHIHEGVAYLQEYRSALITAAVTGQIDVRDHPDAAVDDDE